MIRPQRRMHAIVWLLLGPLLTAAVLALWAARPLWPVNEGPPPAPGVWP